MYQLRIHFPLENYLSCHNCLQNVAWNCLHLEFIYQIMFGRFGQYRQLILSHNKCNSVQIFILCLIWSITECGFSWYFVPVLFFCHQLIQVKCDNICMIDTICERGSVCLFTKSVCHDHVRVHCPGRSKSNWIDVNLGGVVNCNYVAAWKTERVWQM